MFNVVLCSLAVLFVGGSQLDRGPAIQDLAWMAGAWRCEIWGGTFEEHWIGPAGGTMQGIGRHVKGDRTAFMEFLSIEPTEKGLTMWILVGAPSKGEKKGIPFLLTSWKERQAVFENGTHDFPSRIAYSITASGGLDCVLTGTEKGQPRKEEFRFAPIKS